MLHNDQKAQLDFADWIALHRQEEREEHIRKMAAEYVERMPSSVSFNKMAFPWPGSGGASYVSIQGAKSPVGTVDITSIYVEVHPSITGFTRQIIAENIIREQLDLQDEPGYD